jgi:dihydrofolate reductase
MNSTPKIVFSQTLERAPWGAWDEATVVRTRAVDGVAKLKAQPGKNMVIWGSISLAQSLIRERLIDDYRLVVCPLVLGGGRPLFSGDLASIQLQLRDAVPLDRGAVSLTYTPRT